MFVLKLKGYSEFLNHKTIDGEANAITYRGLLSNGKSLIKVIPTMSTSLRNDNTVILEVVEGSVSDDDINTEFYEVPA